MKVLLARTAGFCMGVRRAMGIAVDALENSPPPVRTQGPLIHNRQATELLAARGLEAAESAPAAGTIVIRAHGIPPAERASLEARGLGLIDATCPHVIASQRNIARASADGLPIVLVGDADHPEIRSLAGHAATPVRILSSESEARALDWPGPFAVLGQTTFHAGLYKAICDLLRARHPGVRIFDSICEATDERQSEARELAARADALVVVGGRHSANTRRLAEVARELGRPAFAVETAEELAPGDFAAFRTVAVTAGASTPGWLTTEVIERLETFGPPSAAGAAWRLLRAAAGSRLSTSLGAAALVPALGLLLGPGLVHPGTAALLAGCYVFVAYTLNRRQSPEERARRIAPSDGFYRRHRAALHAAACVAFSAGLFAAARLGPAAVWLFLAANGLAVLYRVPLLSSEHRRRRLRDLPGSKDVLVAAAWALVCSGVVLLDAAGPVARTAGVTATAAVFLLALAKTAMLDLRDSEGDRLVGIETLPIWIGRRRAIWATAAIELLLFALLLTAGGGFACLLSLVALYGLAALAWLTRQRFRGEALCQLVIDGQLWFAGAFAAGWSLAEALRGAGGL